MNTAAPQKTWEATRIQNLLRHKNGRYYARLFLNGKEIWKSLKTAQSSVAEAKMAEVMKEHRERKSRNVEAGDAKLTFGQAAAIHMQRIEERVTIKSGTRKYWRETLAALLKSWPELSEKPVRKITPAANSPTVTPRSPAAIATTTRFRSCATYSVSP